MKKILLICSLVLCTFGAAAKDVAINELKQALTERGYTFKYIPSTKAHQGDKGELATVQIFPYDNKPEITRNVIYSVNLNQPAKYVQEELFYTTEILPMLVDDKEKVTSFLIDSMQNLETKPKQQTVIDGKTFNFYLLGSFVMIIAGEE